LAIEIFYYLSSLRVHTIRIRKKYDGSTYVGPHEEEKVAFKDLPNGFPSVLSSDFQDHYEDVDNLFAMYLLYKLGKHGTRINDETKQLGITKSKNPMACREAARATQRAKSDSENRSTTPRHETAPPPLDARPLTRINGNRHVRHNVII
jgi:hypothetical protein